ncbi:hypothetical protein [Photorhabdus caribbeanensis]|uniref:hypothetical protein n=1 Tax=Photorhabdus caribbeanensis TaxID=1004165 RepID=UPI001BD3D971|nr:hypothetical protein [Photorhabdus caribbeanensis]
MKKNYAVSPQIMNTIEISNEPWGIQDSSSSFIYSNQQQKNLFTTLNNHLIINDFMDINCLEMALNLPKSLLSTLKLS